MFGYVLYHSRCVYDGFNVADLDIIKQAINANKKHGLTGYLHREAGFYVQYYEGDSAAVEQLTANLGADTRHFEMTIIDQGEIAERLFADWSMGYSSSGKTTLGLIDRDDAPFGHAPADVITFLQSAATITAK